MNPRHQYRAAHARPFETWAVPARGELVVRAAVDAVGAAALAAKGLVPPVNLHDEGISASGGTAIMHSAQDEGRPGRAAVPAETGRDGEETVTQRIDPEAAHRPAWASAGDRGLTAFLLIVASIIVRLPTLAQPLTEAHAFRQTQTAYTAVLFARDGIDLLHPKLPVLGPPWEVPFEFPLFQAVASVPMTMGVPAEIALRGTSLIAFALSGAVLWVILARHAGSRAAVFGLGAFLFSPLAMLWSRASLIEFIPTAGALAFVWGVMEWRRSGRSGWWFLALFGGALAVLVKPTTAAFYLAPAVFVLPVRSKAIASVVLIAVPAILGLGWTIHADAIKVASPFTANLTSSALSEWTFGTLAQRLDAGEWATILLRLGVIVGGLVLVPVGLYARARPAVLTLWFAAAAFAPILVFFNLYAIHDYYLTAVAPAFAALFGIGLAAARAPSVRLAAVLAYAAFVVCTAPYWSAAYDPSADPEHLRTQARQLAAATTPDEPIAIRGRDWDPGLLFLASRRGLMLAPWIVSPNLNGYRVFDCPVADVPCSEEH